MSDHQHDQGGDGPLPLGGVIPVPGGTDRRSRQEVRKWKLIQWNLSTLSKTGTIVLTIFSVMYFWNVPLPFIGQWQNLPGAIIAALIVGFVYWPMRRPEAASQTPGVEGAIIKKAFIALIPAFLMPVVLYRYLAVPDADIPDGWGLVFAAVYEAEILYMIADQLYTGIRYSERTTEVGSAPPG